MAVSPLQNVYGPLSPQHAAMTGLTNLQGPNYDFNGQRMSKQDRIDYLKLQILNLNKDLERLTLDDPLPSPTQRQLNNSPALQHAWDELNVIWKLAGK